MVERLGQRGSGSKEARGGRTSDYVGVLVHPEQAEKRGDAQNVARSLRSETRLYLIRGEWKRLPATLVLRRGTYGRAR